jgi:acyl-coenzyme A thioesterase PaaI-like protein
VADEARERLGAASRELLDAVVRTGLPAAELAAAAAQIEELVARLGSVAPRRPQQDNPFHPMSLVGGTAHPVAPQWDFHAVDGGVAGTVVLGPRFEGGPGLAHGGVLALIFDHAMGAAVYIDGNVAMTRTLDVHYLAPTPLDTRLELTARVSRIDGRRVHVHAELASGDTTCASADAVFVRLTADNVTRIFAAQFSDDT